MNYDDVWTCPNCGEQVCMIQGFEQVATSIPDKYPVYGNRVFLPTSCDCGKELGV